MATNELIETPQEPQSNDNQKENIEQALTPTESNDSYSLIDSTQTQTHKVDDPVDIKSESNDQKEDVPALEEINNNDNTTDTDDTKQRINNNNNATDIDPIKYVISDEEKLIYTQINTEKEAITKCIDATVESLITLETDAQQTANTITQTFDALIKSIHDRKNALLNEFNHDVLTQKSDALKQMESLKTYQQTLNDMQSKYLSLSNATSNDDDEKLDGVQRKANILAMSQQFDSTYSQMQFAVDIKLILDRKELDTMIRNFGSIRMGNPGDLDYDPEAVSPIIDSNIDLLLAEIPVKKLFRWTLKSDDEYIWKPRAQRTIILFYQSKNSYKVRMVIRENESDTEGFLMNQWVSIKELKEKESLVWLWTAYDATIAAEENDEKKGYTKWCGRFFDDVAFERFEDQYNQARKINIQVLSNEEKMRKNKLKQEKMERMQQREIDNDVNEEIEDDAEYYENDEKLCFEMSVWRIYLWGNDASGKGSWISYANKSKLQFFRNRNNNKIRIIVRENESKELKLNHWIPTDVTLKSRGDQMWEWQTYDELGTTFLKNTTLKLATICATFIDKQDTEKFKQLFEKYQKINQEAEAM